MSVWLNAVSAGLIALLISPPAIVASSPANVAESLATARDLYAAADYEGSLALLNKLQDASVKSDDARGVGLYRAYCLLALGRQTEAEQAIAVVVAADLLYRPSGSDVSPRVLTAFRDVRRRLLPDLIQARFAQAKASFDAKDFPSALAGFDAVLAVLDDADVRERASQSPLSDLRTLAGGFRELSAHSIPAPAPSAPVAGTAAPAPSPSLAPVVSAPRIFASDDASVTPPVVLKQSLPTLSQFMAVGSGVLEVVVNESGMVETAVMRVPIGPRVDKVILDAARKWKYQPAKRDGVPVKYRKLLQVEAQ